jgi:hypothetical protein
MVGSDIRDHGENGMNVRKLGNSGEGGRRCSV